MRDERSSITSIAGHDGERSRTPRSSSPSPTSRPLRRLGIERTPRESHATFSATRLSILVLLLVLLLILLVLVLSRSRTREATSSSLAQRPSFERLGSARERRRRSAESSSQQTPVPDSPIPRSLSPRSTWTPIPRSPIHLSTDPPALDPPIQRTPTFLLLTTPILQLLDSPIPPDSPIPTCYPYPVSSILPLLYSPIPESTSSRFPRPPVLDLTPRQNHDFRLLPSTSSPIHLFSVPRLLDFPNHSVPDSLVHRFSI
jgi:hypothetical protein